MRFCDQNSPSQNVCQVLPKNILKNNQFYSLFFPFATTETRRWLQCFGEMTLELCGFEITHELWDILSKFLAFFETLWPFSLNFQWLILSLTFCSQEFLYNFSLIMFVLILKKYERPIKFLAIIGQRSLSIIYKFGLIINFFHTSHNLT